PWIQVRMGDEGGPAERAVLGKMLAPEAQAGADVEDDGILTRHLDSHTGGVGAVAPVGLTRARGRTPHAVERHVQQSVPLFAPAQVMRIVPSVDPKETKVTANGLQFCCLELGTGPLALCLHGFPDS